jgi:hypothetical protein
MATFSTAEEAIGDYNYLAMLFDDTWKENRQGSKYIGYMKKEGRRPSLKIVRWQIRGRLDINGSASYDQYIDAWRFFPCFYRHKCKSIFELRQKYYDFMLKQIEKIEVTEEI